jgi:pimeloyl-ACP methyl ester carboxylesterase
MANWSCRRSKFFSNTGGISLPLSLSIVRNAGFAGTLESWGPQVKGLTGAVGPVDEEAPPAGGGAAEGVEVCCFDNRGVGRSSVPAPRSQYT